MRNLAQELRSSWSRKGQLHTCSSQQQSVSGQLDIYQILWSHHPNEETLFLSHFHPSLWHLSANFMQVDSPSDLQSIDTNSTFAVLYYFDLTLSSSGNCNFLLSFDLSYNFCFSSCPVYSCSFLLAIFPIYTPVMSHTCIFAPHVQILFKKSYPISFIPIFF